jgi:putative PEP-CTERM system histidine kinase
MNSPFTNVAVWSYGLAGLGYLGFALYLGFGWRSGLRGLTLLAAVALTALWGLLGLAFVLAPAPWLVVLGGLADVLRYGAWFAFLLLLLDRPPLPNASPVSTRTTWLVPVSAALVVLGFLAQVTLGLGIDALRDTARLVVFDSLALAVFGLVLVEQLFRNVAEESRWTVKPLCLGLAGAFMFDLYLSAEALLFNRYDPDAWGARGFVHALVIPLIALTATRSRDWSFRIALSRRVALHTTALLASGVYLLFIAGAGYYVRYFGGTWGGAIQVALFFAGMLALVALAVSGSMRAKLRVFVGKHFFSYRYDYRDEWLRFTQALSAHDEPLLLGQLAIKGLADMVESPAGGLWLKDAAGRAFAQSARWNAPASADTEDVDGSLAGFLRATGWIVNLEEYRASPERYRDLVLPRWLSELRNAWLIVPLPVGGELIGFVVLSTARTRIDVNWEVNDLLKTAARQAASFLAQVQAADALLEARKFEAFNRMSAFVIHDLKNIIAQLSLLLKNAERHRANPEFQQDMLMTVQNSVERMRQLMMQLREGTTPVDAPRGIDLAAVAGRVQGAKSAQRPAPELQVEAKVAVRGHEDRLERVLGHIVQNAIDATEGGGRVWIRLARDAGSALVEVGDTGHGMTPEFVRERLFKPFQTTKAGGMGIGAYESFQYVRELGGQVQVESAPGTGTCVRLLLPLFDVPAEAALARQGAA